MSSVKDPNFATLISSTAHKHVNHDHQNQNNNTLRINTIPQMYPFHYHLKDFCDTILENTNE